MNAVMDRVRDLVAEYHNALHASVLASYAYAETFPSGDELIEGNAWNDTFWGVCNGVGENWLGQLLMERRAELQRTAAPGGG